MRFRHVDTFEKKVLKTRPSPSDPDFKIKDEMYKQLLLLAIAIIKQMRECVSRVFERYKTFISNLWTMIDFQKNMKNYIESRLEPIVRN